MIITSNPKNVPLNKHFNKEQISSFRNDLNEIDSYRKIQSIIINKDLKELENMLKSGINPDIKNNLGETPLYLCLELDNLDAFKLLLNYNADVNIQRNDGNSILHLAITENKKKFINILLENRANPNLFNKSYNQTCFHLAIINKLDEVTLKKLKQNGANRNIKDKFNKTPFDYAIETKDNNYILLFNEIFAQNDINLTNRDCLDNSKEKVSINPYKFKYLAKSFDPNDHENKENIDSSNFKGDTNYNTTSELYSARDYNITSKNNISNFQETIKEIKINELKDFSLSDSNFKRKKNKNNSENDEENEIKRKCQTYIKSDNKEIMKMIIVNTAKKLNNSQIIHKNNDSKYFTKSSIPEKILQNYENEMNNSATFENTKKVTTLNISEANNFASGISSVIDEKDSNSNTNIIDRNSYKENKNFSRVCNNIIILKDDSISDYTSNYDSLNCSSKYNYEKSVNNSIRESKKYNNMKYMIMKQMKNQNKKSELGSPTHIPNKILSQLRNWLISCDLLNYYNILVEKKFYNISDIITKIKEKQITINYKFVEDKGIRKPGHIFRFLLKMQIDSGILDKNLCDIILEKYCNTNVSNFMVTSSTDNFKCCGISCFSPIPSGSCDFNEFISYINNNDIFAFLRSKNLFEFKDNFIHNGFDQVDFIIIQLFSEFKFNKNFLTEYFHIYHEIEQKKVIKILYEEKEKICKDLMIPFDKKELDEILSEFKEESSDENNSCLIF